MLLRSDRCAGGDGRVTGPRVARERERDIPVCDGGTHHQLAESPSVTHLSLCRAAPKVFVRPQYH